MLIGFVGSPCSGKTTTAARLFATLKDQNSICEFSCEQARCYIAKQRYGFGLSPEKPLNLSDGDQKNIMHDQLFLDRSLVWNTSREGLVISDSSPLGALFYMSESYRDDPKVVEMINESVEMVDILFHSSPVEFVNLDPNRVHSLEQSRIINKSIPIILKTHAQKILPKMTLLTGDSTTRHNKAMTTILSAMLTKR
jgi:hypothetical protein